MKKSIKIKWLSVIKLEGVEMRQTYIGMWNKYKNKITCIQRDTVKIDSKIQQAVKQKETKLFKILI